MSPRVALVTGAGGGIGTAIVKSLLAEGISVAAVDIKNIDYPKQVLEQHGDSLSFFQADISTGKSIERLVNAVVERFSRADILINAAGIVDRTPFFETAEEQWDRVLAVNLRAVFLLSRDVMKVMIDRGDGGRIVNIASLAGEVGGIAVGPGYAASKAGVISLTKTQAKIGGPHGITANAISPGPVQTDMIEDWTADEIDHFVGQTPLGRIGMPGDIAGVVSFLVSDRSAFVSGQVIRVNGGFYV